MAIGVRTCSLLLFVLAVMPSTCNTNWKYVKGVKGVKGANVVAGEAVNHVHNVGRDELCNLKNLLSSNASLAEFQLLVTPSVGKMVSAEMIQETKNSWALVRSVERSLRGAGAHRDVHSKILLELKLYEKPAIVAKEDCELVVIEQLSSGVFADAFQLSRLQQQGAFREAHIYGDTDLERPATKSFQSTVEIRQRLVPNEDAGLNAFLQSEITLPLHARYPPVSSESHDVVNIILPHLLIFCRGDDSLSQGLCIYAQWNDTAAKISSNTLHWSIPSGNPAHGPWVDKLSTAAALTGVAIIFIASKFSMRAH